MHGNSAVNGVRGPVADAPEPVLILETTILATVLPEAHLRMTLEDDNYEEYLARWEEVRGQRKQLTAERYENLAFEYARLLARMDPDDIQLDEWKRMEELRFLLILPAEDDEEFDED